MSSTSERESAPGRRPAVKAATDKKWRPGKTLGKNNIQKRGRPGTKAEREAATRAAKDERAKREIEAASKKRSRDGGDDEEDEGTEDDGEGPDQHDEEEIVPTTSDASAPKKKAKRQNRKTGGTGKKAKVFIEEKSDLLSLAASITGQAEEKSKTRLEKIKQRLQPPPRDPKQPKVSAAKQAQLDAARSVVAQRNKQKKDSKKAEAAPPPPKVDDGKKRVSFA